MKKDENGDVPVVSREALDAADKILPDFGRFLLETGRVKLKEQQKELEND